MNENNKSAYKGDLIVLSVMGAIPISLSLLMLYYYFLSKSFEPPVVLRFIFEVMLSSSTYKVIWSEVTEEWLIPKVSVWIVLGIGLIGYGIYKYWRLKRQLASSKIRGHNT